MVRNIFVLSGNFLYLLNKSDCLMLNLNYICKSHITMLGLLKFLVLNIVNGKIPKYITEAHSLLSFLFACLTYTGRDVSSNPSF